MADTHGLIERIVELHQRLYVAMRSSLAERWMDADYTMPQLKVLLYLYTDGPSRMTSLASALRVCLPSATGIIDRLVERGQVLRKHDPEDRRVVICCLSPEGKERVSELWTASFDLLREILKPLPSEELRTIADGAELMLKAAEHSEGKVTAREPPRAARV